MQWFQAHSKRCGTAMEALLAQHPVTGAEQQNIEALCKLPSVLPSIAHAVVGRFGNLGRLMDELARARGRCGCWSVCAWVARGGLGWGQPGGPLPPSHH